MAKQKHLLIFLLYLGHSMFNAQKGKKTYAVIVGIICFCFIVGAVYFWVATRSLVSTTGEYQAVFLSNGQVYFGRIEKQNRKDIILTHVYYLQVQGQLQEKTTDRTLSDQPDLSLVKLGSELHAPQDAMYINRDHVLFIENLKEESRVVQAIQSYQQKI